MESRYSRVPRHHNRVMKATRRLLLLVAALALAQGRAAPKVDIRVVPRPRAPVEAPETGPFPIRAPVWVGAGPFWQNVAELACVSDVAASFNDEEYLVDVCALRNVTVVQKPPPVEEQSGELQTPPPKLEPRKLLGIFRGWKIDPITLKYKYMEFDDGDVCSGGERFAVTLELVPSKSPETPARVVDLKHVETCKFSGKLIAHVPEDDRVATQGIHTGGVVDISDAAESLPAICGEMKCSYSDLSSYVRHVNQQLRKLQLFIQESSTEGTTLRTQFTMESVSSTLKLSASVLNKSLELIGALEEKYNAVTKLPRDDSERGKTVTDEVAVDPSGSSEAIKKTAENVAES